MWLQHYGVLHFDESAKFRTLDTFLIRANISSISCSSVAKIYQQNPDTWRIDSSQKIWKISLRWKFPEESKSALVFYIRRMTINASPVRSWPSVFHSCVCIVRKAVHLLSLSGGKEAQEYWGWSAELSGLSSLVPRPSGINWHWILSSNPPRRVLWRS